MTLLLIGMLILDAVMATMNVLNRHAFAAAMSGFAAGCVTIALLDRSNR